MPRTEFHQLTVARVDPLTDDSAAVTFDVPPGLAERFAFTPGQSLTVRRGDVIVEACREAFVDRAADVTGGDQLLLHRAGDGR